MRSTWNTVSVTLLAASATIWTLYYAKDFFAPVLLAFVVGVVLSPLSVMWERLRVPAALGASITVALAVGVIFALILLIEPYISQALRQAPIIRAELREVVYEARRILRGLEQISDEMAAAIEQDGGAPADSEEQVKLPTLTDALFYAPKFLAQTLIFAGTLYFFMLTRTTLYDWLRDTFATLGKSDLNKAATMVSRYVWTISAINLGFGVLVAIVMRAIGMPSPEIWGLLAFMLNFILYLGPASLFVMLTIAGIVTFDGPATFLPPLLYLAMNATEAQFVTPTLVSKSLAVNPLLIFLSLVFWIWLWGPVGGIIAIPLLIWVRTVTNRLAVPQLRVPQSDAIARPAE